MTSTATPSRIDLFRAGQRFEYQLKDCRVDNVLLNLKLAARTSTAAMVVVHETSPQRYATTVEYVILGAVGLVLLKLFISR